MKSPLQKISAKMASLERRWGYFKSDNTKILSDLTIRLSDLENLLSPRIPPGDPDTERSEVVSCMQCMDLPQARRQTWDNFMRVHRQYHNRAGEDGP